MSATCVVCSKDIAAAVKFCPTCGAEQPQSQAEGSDPLIGTVIARNFRVEKLLGTGGMGKVFKARQLSLDKVVVIKVLHDHFRDDGQLVQRFQREAKAASRLSHPNSISVIDFGQDEAGILYMAIEFLDGEDLFTILTDNGPFAEQRIANIMTQVCSALAEAHEMNVIHRDLKPENIMIENKKRGRKDVVKVLDFGIAKIQDPDESEAQALTQAGMVCGTPEYMSPEQARGKSIDARADLYSLGVLTYQLVTGELPFHAETPIGIVTKHIIEEPVPPSERFPNLDISDALEKLILKAMAKAPEERFQTADEMGEAFEALSRAQTLSGVESAEQPVAKAEVEVNTIPAPRPNAADETAGVRLQSDPVAASAPPSGGMGKAALVFGVILGVGLLGLAAVKLLSPGDERVAELKPAGQITPKAIPESPTVQPTENEAAVAPPADKPQIPPTAKDKGEDEATTDPKEGKTESPNARVRSGGRKKANALFTKAQRLMVSGRNLDTAYRYLKDALKADSTFLEPIQLISRYWLKKNQPTKSCAAMKDYVGRKGRAGEMSERKAKVLLKTARCSGDDLKTRTRRKR